VLKNKEKRGGQGMTRKEIIRLKPGPELDRLVAEKVMGWIEPADAEMPRVWLRWEEGEKRYVWAGWWIEEPPKDEDGNIPSAWLLAGNKKWSPSTDIAAAWEVVERLSSRCFIQIHNQVASFMPLWNVSFESREDMKFLGSANAETVPLAICRAALAVMEHNKKERVSVEGAK